ncbi:MAG TPA: DUF2461 domain-containing protein [Planctomycetaceae bacterium]|nr:DUF2461 domain-containing protein [Planctomycetaceae bacterium]
MEFRRFEPSIFQFLEQLADNNNRAWFEENRWRYEEEVREPCLAFIRAFRPRLERISPFFEASDRRSGGSLIRIYRDVRFARDKRPYKTNVGIQFRHQWGRDIHSPGFYVHIEPGDCFLAVGVWRPDRDSLGQIRQALMENPRRWRRVVNASLFRRHFQLAGHRLKRPPRGVPPDHPLVEDLKRTDFLGLQTLEEQDVLDPSYLDHVTAAFTAARSFMRLLCDAVRMPF